MNYNGLTIRTIHDTIALAMLEFPEDIPTVMRVYDALVVYYNHVLTTWRMSVRDIQPLDVVAIALLIERNDSSIIDAMGY